MKDYQIWISQLNLIDTPSKVDCYRCNTKSTHALIRGQIKANINPQINNEKRHKERFLLIQCSTCQAFTIKYEFEEGTVSSAIPEGSGKTELTFGFKPKKIITIPFSSRDIDLPDLIKKDFNLMHMCHQIGSYQGVSVHCRRILDRIFIKFEKQYLKEEEIKASKSIKERAELIAERCAYFGEINEVLKLLKGTVSIIIHTPEEDLVAKSKLTINDSTFKEINDIILANVKAYDYVFSTMGKLISKYKKS